MINFVCIQLRLYQATDNTVAKIIKTRFIVLTAPRIYSLNDISKIIFHSPICNDYLSNKNSFPVHVAIDQLVIMAEEDCSLLSHIAGEN